MLQVREDCVEMASRLPHLARTTISFLAAFIPPEPHGKDDISLRIDDIRCWLAIPEETHSNCVLDPCLDDRSVSSESRASSFELESTGRASERQSVYEASDNGESFDADTSPSTCSSAPSYTMRELRDALCGDTRPSRFHVQSGKFKSLKVLISQTRSLPFAPRTLQRNLA